MRPALRRVRAWGESVHRPFRATVIAPVVAAILTVSAIAVAGTLSTRGTPSSGSAPRSLKIHGHVRGMYPGRSAILRLHVRNPLTVRVGVYRIRVHVRRGAGPNGTCPATMLAVKPWRGMRRVRGGQTRVFRLRTRMVRRAPDRCQGTRWHLTYDAKSVRV